MGVSEEFAFKRARAAALIAAQGLGGLVLGRSASWSWAMCGREANVALNSEEAVAVLVLTPQRDYLVANQIEMPRLLAEELGDLPFEPVVFPWYEPGRRDALIAELVTGPVGADVVVAGARLLVPQIAALRSVLTVDEQVRLRLLGRATGAAVESAARAIVPGMSEYEIAGVLASETWCRGATPVVTLIAVDDRVHRFRHPCATGRRMERYAMLVLCARRGGLIVSATRLVHVGPVPDVLQARARACAQVDAAVMAATRPGVSFGAVFARLQAAYAAVGYDGEWVYHHQGGLAGYENREVVAMPSQDVIVRVGQAYAWNPSIAGVKSEDTILIDADGYEVVTATNDWPMYDVVVDGGRGVRPAILER